MHSSIEDSNYQDSNSKPCRQSSNKRHIKTSYSSVCLYGVGVFFILPLGLLSNHHWQFDLQIEWIKEEAQTELTI